MEERDLSIAYHLGVFMGDGFVERYKKGSKCCYIGLKSIDLDFVQHWRNNAAKFTKKIYSIHEEKSKELKKNGQPRRVRYRCRIGKKKIVQFSLDQTEHKTKIPKVILQGPDELKKAFLQGLMDSEGWIVCTLKPIGTSTLGLWFAVSDEWCKDVRQLFIDLGIEVSKLHRRKYSEDPKYLKKRKDTLQFQINILDYIKAGLGFNIKRKQDRLDYCSTILRGHTRDYPRYSDYLG